MAGKVYLERIATATFDSDVHDAFVGYAHGMLQQERSRTLFLRMAERSGIAARYSPLFVDGTHGPSDVDAYGLYRAGSFPATARRMELYKQFAPVLMRRALDRLALSAEERQRIRHVIVTSCTGFYAPGLDFDAVDYLGLDASVERTMIGFMGCYAAMNALKQARHIVRSEPDDSVLVINLEICTLHLQESQDLGEVLSFLVFGDGCAASLVSGRESGIELESFRAIRLENTADLITWDIGDQGFDMVLSGQVPTAVGQALQAHREDFVRGGTVRLWAVHPGGRSVLDAVEEALALPADALKASREVLRQFGNMSSATVMFVLESMLQTAGAGERGCAMAFGPGLTAETMQFVTASKAV
ncbi:putative naringenin-chalcone synthase [Terriglobus roseus DSM 18391]|uniref:Putative naringenin-chalcone synthase n=1 Tax=Terriglobus roseus (strain DSM 18391 / NRRL B-41598 / KBS 63) TaxID=926566 RepID=I3ZMJ3_TERRK|nr:type III polyketide synthase [Terriglobus roseus]AFL90461.1 putative naringenin-chalcone synthase [Terriglobus roseus DSM 18391]